jgi:hypothetical protein
MQIELQTEDGQTFIVDADIFGQVGVHGWQGGYSVTHLLSKTSLIPKSCTLVSDDINRAAYRAAVALAKKFAWIDLDYYWRNDKKDAGESARYHAIIREWRIEYDVDFEGVKDRKPHQLVLC